MTDAPEPQDKAVLAMCEDLKKLRDGLATLDLHAHMLDRVIAKLKEQALEIERVRSDQQYIIGHNDGWDAAFATGHVGDDASPPEP